MRYRFLLLACCLFANSAYALQPERKLPRPIDEIIVNEMTEPIQLADLEVLVVTSPAQCAAPPNGQKPTDAVLLRLFACKAFAMAFDEGDSTLPFHGYQPATRLRSAKATFEASKPVLSGRRYVAMIAWDVFFKGNPRACEPCLFPVEVPLEIAVLDTKTGQRVWQSYHLSQIWYRGRAFDAQNARLLGLTGIERLIKMILSQRQVLDAEAAGLRRTQGFMMMDKEMKTPPLNPRARLIITNDAYLEKGYLEEARATVQLTSLSAGKETRGLYTIPVHGFAAFDLPPGKYALTASKNSNYEFEIGEAPVLLAVRRPTLTQPDEVRAISADYLGDLSEDLVNALLSENMPASYHVKNHFIYWTQP